MIRRNAPIQAARATRRAFTLLEVLVVVAIIVMLAGVGGYYIIQRYDDAKVQLAKTRARDIAAKVEMYYIQNNSTYPDSIEALTQPQPSGLEPLLPREACIDPWGKPFTITQEADAGGVQRIVVWTTNPKGLKLTNHN